MPNTKELAEPWRSFLADVDGLLNQNVELHCCGGFVVTQVYGVARTTSDVDYLAVVPSLRDALAEIAGKGSAFHRKHKLFLDAVTVVTPPENYADRLQAMFPDAWTRLRLFALDAHDLALSKLERNFERDRDDVQRLAQAGYLKAEILEERYYKELRPNLLAHEARHDLTLKIWLESYWLR